MKNHMNVQPGFYRYSLPDWKQSIIVEVKDGKVRFNTSSIPTRIQDIPQNAQFKPLTLDDISHKRSLVITIKAQPSVAIKLPDNLPETPSKILDAYAKKYDIERYTLGYAIVHYIEMPTP